MRNDVHHRSYFIASILVAIVSFVLAIPRQHSPVHEISGKVVRVTPYMGRVLAVDLDSGSVVKFSHVGRRHPLRALHANDEVVLSAYSKSAGDTWGTSLKRNEVVLYSDRYHRKCRAVHSFGWLVIGIIALVFSIMSFLRSKRVALSR